MGVLHKTIGKLAYNQKEEWDTMALDSLRHGQKILDIGCGQGRFIARDPKRIWGVDHNEQTIEACRAKGYRVELAKVTSLPFADETFDGIYASHVIEHLQPDQAYKFLKEADRVLRPGGIFCIQTPLLYDGFYNDFTHVKPYNPQAILHYLGTKQFEQKTLGDIESKYEKVRLIYRRQYLFSWAASSNPRLWLLSRILYRFGMTSLTRNGYMLVLRKVP